MRVKQAFMNGRALVPFLLCGYPDLETTEQVIYALEKSGANLILLGVPFSDPTGEGPTLRRANEAALRAGVDMKGIFDLVGRARRNTSIPLALMTYANVVFSYGAERFLQTAAQVGIDALVLRDVPYEEKGEFSAFCQEAGVNFISMVAPTSEARLMRIAQEAQGFIYLVSPCGAPAVVSKLRQFTTVPVVVAYSGYGEFSIQSALEAAEQADGVIIEAAIMEIVAQHGKNAPQAVYDYTRGIIGAATIPI